MLFDKIFKTHRAEILSCFGLGAGVWLTTWLIFRAFRLFSPIFFIALYTWLELPHPSIVGIFQCVCTQPIDLMGIHFLRCVHGIKRTRTHDVIRDTFATIVWDADFHMGRKQLYALPSTTFNSFCWWINIVVTKDGIRTLVDVLIVDPTWVDLFFRSCVIQGFAILI
jgi:hypothetical protein